MGRHKAQRTTSSDSFARRWFCCPQCAGDRRSMATPSMSTNCEYESENTPRSLCAYLRSPPAPRPVSTVGGRCTPMYSYRMLACLRVCFPNRGSKHDPSGNMFRALTTRRTRDHTRRILAVIPGKSDPQDTVLFGSRGRLRTLTARKGRAAQVTQCHLLAGRQPQQAPAHVHARVHAIPRPYAREYLASKIKRLGSAASDPVCSEDVLGATAPLPPEIHREYDFSEEERLATLARAAGRVSSAWVSGPRVRA